MNNNIGNMNSANPLGFNPQGHKAPCSGEFCKPEETQEEIYEDKDPLKHVPGDNYGRAMINRSSSHQPIETSPIEDDIFTLEILNEFAQDLMDGYIKKGMEPQKAYDRVVMVLDALLNPRENS